MLTNCLNEESIKLTIDPAMHPGPDKIESLWGDVIPKENQVIYIYGKLYKFSKRGKI